MSPDEYNALAAEAADLRAQLNAASDEGKPALRVQLAANALVVRATLIHEHLMVCQAPHARCGWNNVQYPFDPRVEESWTPANKVAMLAATAEKIQSGESNPVVPAVSEGL